MKNLLGLVLVLVVTTISAQDDIARELNNLRWGMEVRDNYSINHENVEGSPFLNTEFIPSVVFLKKDEPLELKLRLNAYEHYFEFQNQSVLYALKSSEVDSIRYGDDIFIYKELLSKKKKETLPFAIVEQEQNFILYRLDKIRFIRAKEEQVYKDAQPSKFQPAEPEYFLQSHDQLILLKTFNTIYKLFPKQKNELKSFIRSHKISRNSEKDLIKLVNFLEENH